MALLFTLVRLLKYSFNWFNWCCLDVFSRRYIKSLELLRDCDETEISDCDETEISDGAARQSITSSSSRKSSQIPINSSENAGEIDNKKHS